MLADPASASAGASGKPSTHDQPGSGASGARTNPATIAGWVNAASSATVAPKDIPTIATVPNPSASTSMTRSSQCR